LDKYLIINADDYGSFYGANMATQELLESGNITSATVMMPCMWARQACRYAKEHPEFAIGVHLTTTAEWGACKWGPVNSKGTDSLRDAEGYMWNDSDLFEENADLEEARNECIAQLELAKKLGLDPSHWDNHMGSLYGIETGRLELLEMILELSAAYKLPFRFPIQGLGGLQGTDALSTDFDMDTIMFLFGQIQGFVKDRGVICPDYLIVPQYKSENSSTYEQIRDYLFQFVEQFPPGVTETFIHPCTDTGEITAASHGGIRRVWEYTVFMDPKFQQHLKDLGIRKINYRDLAKMKG